MELQVIKDFHKIGKALNREVNRRIINYLIQNADQTLCIKEICDRNNLKYHRTHYYFKEMAEIRVLHLKEDGCEKLVFLDYDRLNTYYQTASYLSAAMKERSSERQKTLYG